MGASIEDGKYKADWDDLLEEGINLREKGDPRDLNESVHLLVDAYKIAPKLEDKLDVLNHLGLTYIHLKDYQKAIDTWNKVLVESNVQSPPLLKSKAVALRNLSRKQFCESESDFETALAKACEARNLAVKLEMPNLVWFTHGLFSAKQALMKFQKRADTEVLEELKDIARTEKNELKKVWKETSKMQRNVWLGGLLMDYAVVYKKVSKPLLKVARFFVKLQNLKRREEQIDKLLEEMS